MATMVSENQIATVHNVSDYIHYTHNNCCFRVDVKI